MTLTFDDITYKMRYKINERHRSWSDVSDILEEEFVDTKIINLLNITTMFGALILLLAVYSGLYSLCILK